MVRAWVNEYGTPQDIAGALVNAYSEASEANKEHIGKLLAMVFESRSEELAEECAGKYGVKIRPCRSVGESICVGDCDNISDLRFRMDFTRLVKGWPTVVEEFRKDRYTHIVPSDAVRQILAISITDRIHVFRHIDGSVRLFIIEDIPASILVDEEKFGDEPPMYFTESSHFLSPVFKLNLVERLLDFCLAKIGYPYVKVLKSVVFSSPEAELINGADYFPGGDCAQQWEGVEVVLRRYNRNNTIFRDITSFLKPENLENALENEHTAMLLFALGAVSLMYKEIIDTRRNYYPSDHALDKMAKSIGIFKPWKK